MKVLGIESSCDDTAVALFEGRGGLIGHLRHSQIDVHRRYGGVVPELAARDHIARLSPLIHSLLLETATPLGGIGGVAYTRGPGLSGALLVGAALGRSLAMGLGVPAIGIHHMEGHLLSPMLEEPAPQIPFIALLVSGGHTLLVEVKKLGRYRVLGESMDDAAGEAFDKTAKLLGLGYPGGPALAAAAGAGDPDRFRFPRPMTDRPGLDFSFSGLKTHARITIEKHRLDDQTVSDIAWAFQDAVADTLLIKTRRALQMTGIGKVVIAGGVGANAEIRRRFSEYSRRSGTSMFYPRLEFCTDNGAMIAYAGWLRLSAGQNDPTDFGVRPRWTLGELPPI